MFIATAIASFFTLSLGAYAGARAVTSARISRSRRLRDRYQRGAGRLRRGVEPGTAASPGPSAQATQNLQNQLATRGSNCACNY